MNNSIDQYIPVIDFDTDKIIFVVYPPGAGGNFLASMLGLSDSAVFMDTVLAKKQINNAFSTEDKMHYLRNHFDIMSHEKQWSDMGLGNMQFYGTYEAVAETQSILKYSITEYGVSHVIKSDKYFFCTVHDMFLLPSISRIWKNAKIIFFYNCYDFVTQRPTLNRVSNNKSELRNKYWDVIKSASFPASPPANISEFINLDPDIKHELINNFNSKIIYMLDDFTDTKEDLTLSIYNKMDSYKDWASLENVRLWDNSWFLNENETIAHINEIYIDYEFEHVNINYLKEYYTMWSNITVSRN